MNYKNLIVFVLITFGGLLLFSCVKDEPSILKVFARNSDNTLTEGVSVRIVGDLSMGTPEYLGEAKTDSSGVALFNLNDFFDQYDSGEEKVAYFTIYAQDVSQFYTTVGKVRAKANLTSTETIILKN